MLSRKITLAQVLSILLLLPLVGSKQKNTICGKIDKTVELDAKYQYIIPNYETYTLPEEITIISQKPKGKM